MKHRVATKNRFPAGGEKESTRPKIFWSIPVVIWVIGVGLLTAVGAILAPEGAARNGDFLLWFCGTFVWGGLGLLWGTIGFPTTQTPSVRFALRSDVFLAWVTILLMGWMVASLFWLVKTGYGNIPYAVNMMAAVGGIFCFAFFCARGGRGLRAVMVTVLLAVALGESVFALYAYSVRDPAFRAEYQADPNRVLAASGIDYPPGSTERFLLEQRILHSTEPLATYGLTNTLAGVLVPMLTLLVGIAFWNFFLGFSRKNCKTTVSDRAERRRWIRIITALAILVPLAGVLILTKSRAGYLASLAGVLFALVAVMISLATTARGQRIFWTILLAVPIFFVALAAGAYALGFLDAEVFSEAKMSLGYRLDYWGASCRMIANHPIFGVGPGNFQACYPRWMNPTASEIVADPHNFFFETAAVFGLPAALLFVLMILLLGWRAVQSAKSMVPFFDPPCEESFPTLYAALAVVIGILAAFGISLDTSAPVDFDFLLAAIPAGLVGVMVAKILFTDSIPRPIFFAAFLASLVNLSAAGGIFFPATAIPLAIFAAMIVAPAEGGAEEWTERLPEASAESFRRKIGERILVGMATAVGMILMLMVSLHLLTRVGEKEILQRVDEGGRAGKSPTQIVSYFSSRPLLGSTSIPFEQQRFRGNLAAAESAFREKKRTEWSLIEKKGLFEAAPQSAPIRCRAGIEEFAAFERTRAIPFLTGAVESFTEAVARGPHHAEYRARLGLARIRLGDIDAGRESLREAIRLDDAMPHLDRKLPAELRRAVEMSLRRVD